MNNNREEVKNTVKFFMGTYEGFDWENGTIVIVENNRPHLFRKGDVFCHICLPDYENKVIRCWTCDEHVMIMTV